MKRIKTGKTGIKPSKRGDKIINRKYQSNENSKNE